MATQEELQVLQTNFVKVQNQAKDVERRMAEMKGHKTALLAQQAELGRQLKTDYNVKSPAELEARVAQLMQEETKMLADAEAELEKLDTVLRQCETALAAH